MHAANQNLGNKSSGDWPETLVYVRECDGRTLWLETIRSNKMTNILMETRMCSSPIFNDGLFSMLNGIGDIRYLHYSLPSVGLIQYMDRNFHPYAICVTSPLWLCAGPIICTVIIHYWFLYFKETFIRPFMCHVIVFAIDAVLIRDLDSVFRFTIFIYWLSKFKNSCHLSIGTCYIILKTNV